MTDTLEPLDIRKLQRPVIAIVSYVESPQMPTFPRSGRFYQVTIDPRAVSPSGEFIRFGGIHGDEIMGWQEIADLQVEEVLAEYAPDQALPYIQGNTIEILAGKFHDAKHADEAAAVPADAAERGNDAGQA